MITEKKGNPMKIRKCKNCNSFVNEWEDFCQVCGRYNPRYPTEFDNGVDIVMSIKVESQSEAEETAQLMENTAESCGTQNYHKESAATEEADLFKDISLLLNLDYQSDLERIDLKNIERIMQKIEAANYSSEQWKDLLCYLLATHKKEKVKK